MQKGGIEKIYVGLKMAPVSRTGGGQICTDTTVKYPIRRSVVSSFTIPKGSLSFNKENVVTGLEELLLDL